MDKLLKPTSSHFKKGRVFDSIYSRKEFFEVVQRERLRTHRNHVPFSVLIFGTDAATGKHKVLEDLLKILLPRVRATDEIGWYSENQIALLLPDTLPEGAGMLAKEVIDKMDEESLLLYEIRYYPRKKDPDTSGDKGIPSETDDEKGGPEHNESTICDECAEIEEIFAPPDPVWKRGLDILGAGLGLVILFPVFLFIGAFIKIVSPGPVFYKQTRVGFRKKLFTCWKFRTMKAEADTTTHKKYLQALIKNENECMIKLDDSDARIIPCGKILRKTGLDELPQLINILLGDMSLVGPRPCTVYEAREYRIWQHRRFDNKPGLTGLWQVSGKNKTTFVEMIRLDIGYGISKSLLKDLWIMIRTFPAVCGQVFDRLPSSLPPKKGRFYEKSTKNRRGWLRVLGAKSDSKF
jgi:lipopolysaccharide/colanic/teichoic acid biosynthesis glycosyltransferase